MVAMAQQLLRGSGLQTRTCSCRRSSTKKCVVLVRAGQGPIRAAQQAVRYAAGFTLAVWLLIPYPGVGLPKAHMSWALLYLLHRVQMQVCMVSDCSGTARCMGDLHYSCLGTTSICTALPCALVWQGSPKRSAPEGVDPDIMHRWSAPGSISDRGLQHSDLYLHSPARAGGWS